MGRPRKPKDDHPRIGHNGGQITDDNQRKLQGYVAEIERINTKMDVLKADAKDILDSAKDSNFDVKAIRAIVKERKVERSMREAFEGVMDAYRHALGMLADTPLGQAAIEKAAGPRRTVEKPPAVEPQHPSTADAPFLPPDDDTLRVPAEPEPEMPTAPAAPQ